jgi:hypothetical protein
MLLSDFQRRECKCPSCGQLVYLLRNGFYRRHFATEPDGRGHLCVASGGRPDGVVQLLTVDPTPQERYSHALRLLQQHGVAPPSKTAA